MTPTPNFAVTQSQPHYSHLCTSHLILRILPLSRDLIPRKPSNNAPNPFYPWNPFTPQPPPIYLSFYESSHFPGTSFWENHPPTLLILGTSLKSIPLSWNDPELSSVSQSHSSHLPLNLRFQFSGTPFRENHPITPRLPDPYFILGISMKSPPQKSLPQPLKPPLQKRLRWGGH
jgi:hypothetical protein